MDPRELHGTKANHIEPGIVESMPKELSLKDVDEVAMLLSQVSSYTFMPMGDMASSNMYILKDWGKFYESTLLPRFGGRLLFFPDNCGTRKHHRAKQDLKDLKRHILRHYSMNKLLREQKMQMSCSERLEVLVKQKVKMRIGKPPEDALTLREVVDIIFHLDAEWHKRARGKTSQFHTDLEALCPPRGRDFVSCWIIRGGNHRAKTSSGVPFRGARLQQPSRRTLARKHQA